MTVLLYIGTGLAVLVLAFLIELVIAAFYPWVTVMKQPLDGGSSRSHEGSSPAELPGKKVKIHVKGIDIDARLLLPENILLPVPCVVMAHGLGGTMNMGLDVYANRFREAGMAVLLFDYRYMGQSGGEPRQLIWIPFQLEDYAAAIDFARQQEWIDPRRIALWGTSLSGGHVLVAAAKDNRVACVCAQCPLIDGTEAAEAQLPRVGFKAAMQHMIRMVGHGQRDLVRSWFRLSPHKIPIVGKPDTVAHMPDSEAWAAFEQLAPPDYVNEACARICIRIDKYRPIKHLDEICCPVLIQACDYDFALPSSVLAKAEQKLGKLATVIHYPISHFAIYTGENLEKAVNDQIVFFRRHLLREK